MLARHKLLIVNSDFYKDKSPAHYRLKALMSSLDADQWEVEVIGINYEECHEQKPLKKIWSIAKFLLDIACKTNKDQLVLVSSSKLLTSVWVYFVSFFKRFLFVVDFRDILFVNLKFSPSIIHVMAYPLAKVLTRAVEYKCISIVINSPGFYKHLSVRSHGKTQLVLNGADEVFMPTGTKLSGGKSEGKFIIGYAGNIGQSQGLQDFIPQLAMATGNQYEIRIVGNGKCKAELENNLKVANVDNVKIFDTVPREELIGFYNDCDVLLCSLRNTESMKDVMPSKLYEYVATGIPIIAGVKGVAEEYWKSKYNNIHFFDPMDVSFALKSLQYFQDLNFRRMSPPLQVHRQYQTVRFRSVLESAVNVSFSGPIEY